MAFLNRVLACFRAHAEVLTHQGREFLESFDALRIKTLVDHHTMSEHHHDIDGLVE